MLVYRVCINSYISCSFFRKKIDIQKTIHGSVLKPNRLKNIAAQLLSAAVRTLHYTLHFIPTYQHKWSLLSLPPRSVEWNIRENLCPKNFNTILLEWIHVFGLFKYQWELLHVNFSWVVFFESNVNIWTNGSPCH